MIIIIYIYKNNIEWLALQKYIVQTVAHYCMHTSFEKIYFH